MADGNRAGRVYGGRSPAEREAARRQALVNAAIDTLAAGEKLTVRGLCTRTGLTSRYFYENFSSTDALAETAYDTCVAGIAETVAAAFATPHDLPDQIAHAMNALVESLEKDPRAGHILFSHRIADPLIACKRQESTEFFAQITAATAGTAVRSSVDVGHAAQFVVGGVTQLLSVWLNSDDRPDTAAGGLDGPAVARLAATMITALAAQLTEAPTSSSSSPQDPSPTTRTPPLRGDHG